MAQREGIFIEFGPQFRAVAEALREVDDTLTPKFKNALESAAAPVLAELKAAALRLPAHKLKHTGLRARIAAGVGMKRTFQGVRFTTSMPPGEEELPRGEDSGLKGWRHPVYGNQNNWVHQIGGSWFRETIANDRPQFENKMQDVLDQARDQIDRAGHV